MPNPKPATVGEKVMSAHVGRLLEDFRTSPLYFMERLLARRIDAVVKREVKKALKARGK